MKNIRQKRIASAESSLGRSDPVAAILVIFMLLPLLFACSAPGQAAKDRHLRDAAPVNNTSADTTPLEARSNPFPDLSVPTQITKIEDTYFIVDCYHNQVIYNDNLTDPLTEWKVMTDEMAMGHTIAGDGDIYLIDDTENERIMVLEKKDDAFAFTQQFEGVTGRPHYIIYDDNEKCFYAWCSVSGELYVIRNDPEGPAYISDIRRIPELDGVYVRSFTIIGDEILFVSGNNCIIKARLDTLKVTERYPVPDEISGMIQITPIDGQYYITVSTNSSWDQSYATIIRCERLEDLAEGKYEDIYKNFIGGGTPYYITGFDGSYYLTEHRLPGHSIWRFTIDNGKISAETVY